MDGERAKQAKAMLDDNLRLVFQNLKLKIRLNTQLRQNEKERKKMETTLALINDLFRFNI
jgi:hypothetical protein